MLANRMRTLIAALMLGLGLEGSPSAAATTTVKLNWHPCAGPNAKPCHAPDRAEAEIFATVAQIQSGLDPMSIKNAVRQARYTGSLSVDMGFATQSGDVHPTKRIGMSKGTDPAQAMIVLMTLLGMGFIPFVCSLRRSKKRKRKRICRSYTLPRRVSTDRPAVFLRRQVGWITPLRRHRPIEGHAGQVYV